MLTSEFARHFPESRCSFSCSFRSLRCSKNESLLFHLCGDSISQWQCGGRGPTFCLRKLSKIALYCWVGWMCEVLTLLSRAPTMLGPWQWSKLSWLTGCWWIRFFTISRKAAMLFLSNLLSTRKKKNRKIKNSSFTHLHTYFTILLCKLHYVVFWHHPSESFLVLSCLCMTVLTVSVFLCKKNFSSLKLWIRAHKWLKPLVPIFREVCYLCGLHSKCIHSIWFLSEALALPVYFDTMNQTQMVPFLEVSERATTWNCRNFDNVMKM